MIFYNNIGKNILHKRKEAGMTQEQFAEKLGISNRSISRWENGKTIPDISLFPSICQELGISLTELLTGKNEEKAEIKESVMLLVNILGEENRKYIQKMSRYFVSGFICLGVVLLQVEFGILDFAVTPQSVTWLLAVLGVLCEMLGIYYSSQRIAYTEKDITVFLESEANIKLSSAREMLQYAKRKQRVDYKQYEKAFQAIEQKLAEDEKVLFSMVADSLIQNEGWQDSWKPWHVALAITDTSILISGESIRGRFMTHFDVESYNLSDVVDVNYINGKIVIRLMKETLTIEGKQLENVFEALKECIQK